MHFRFRLVLTFLFSIATAVGHEKSGATVPSARALKVDAPLVVDGILDEAFWKEAPVATGLIDQRTQQPAEQQTLVRIAYSRTHLYVAVECLDDDMEEIHASERREDRVFTGDDWVEIHFDPPHTHRSKYAFFSNPLGTRADANEGPSGVFNYGWSAEWELEAKVLEDRWVFEMKIPFSVMNYQRKDGQVWGLNVTRCLRRTDTTSFWSFNPTEYYKPRHFGHLTGLDLADTVFKRLWEFTPYVSTRTDFDGDTDTFFQTGLDVSFRLAPSITTAWTLNPDFGQVESDDDTIELRDTERFLPEKRLFFREGDELMRMSHRLYYSRRFTDITAGAKASGNWNGYNFTFLNMLGEMVHDGTYEGNSSVFRLLQNVKERSSLVYYVADSEFTGGHSRVVSADGYLFLTDAWRYSFQLSGADERLSDGSGNVTKNRFDFLGDFSLIYSTYPWEFNLGYRAISEGFNPMLGYIPRRNIFGPAFLARYGHDSRSRWYKRLFVSYSLQYYDNEAGATALRDHSVNASVIFPKDFGFWAARNEDYHAPFHNSRTSIGLQLFVSDYWKSWEASWGGGRFETTDYHELRLAKPFKPFERLPIRYEFTIRFEDKPLLGSELVWLNRIVFDYYFTDEMWLKTSLQHRGHGIRNLSVIYGWKVRRNTNWYVVFNDVDHEDEAGRSLFTKVTHTF
jgi:hypothetical protein